MAFCKNCGTQLQGDERFCVGCGKDVSANGTAGPVVNTPPAQAVAAVGAAKGQAVATPVAPGVTTAPGPYAAPGTIPIMVTMPPQAPAKRGGMIWVLVVVGVLVGAYYYLKPPPAPPPDPAALTKQQAFDARWDNVYGWVQISNGKWTNHATVPIDSAELECDQFNTSGAELAQMRKTLPGPLQPGASTIYNPFQMGAVETDTNKVTCTIVHVKAVNSGQ